QPVARDYAEKLNELVDVMGIERFNLLGHSLGTLIATDYARLFPDKVDALILLSCAQGYGMQADDSLPDKAQQRLLGLETEGALVFAQKRAPRLLHNPESKPVLAKAAVEAMSLINPDGYRQAVHMLAAGNLKQAASEVRTDSLIVSALEDVITPCKQSRDCHDALRNADATLKHEYIEVPNAGHLVHQEEPELVARHIMAFTGWDSASVVEQSA
nr:alpha/beta hydrolase [Granulosicoccus sp.]